MRLQALGTIRERERARERERGRDSALDSTLNVPIVELAMILYRFMSVETACNTDFMR